MTKRVSKKEQDAPAWRMVVGEPGYLVAADQFEFEKLASWAKGTKVLVRMTFEKDRPLIRKWWAIIGNYLKTGMLTQFADDVTASDAIKLAIGYIDVKRDEATGVWASKPRSLSDADDAELDAMIEQMCAIMFRYTGIDAEQLRREYGSHDSANFSAPNPYESSDPNPPEPGQMTGADDAPSSAPPNATDVTDPSSSGDAGAQGVSEAAEGESAGDGALTDAHREWLVSFTKQIVSASWKGDPLMFKAALDGFSHAGVPPEIRALPKEHPVRSDAQKILDLCKLVVKGERPEFVEDDSDLSTIAVIAGCKTVDLRPKMTAAELKEHRARRDAK